MGVDIEFYVEHKNYDKNWQPVLAPKIERMCTKYYPYRWWILRNYSLFGILSGKFYETGMDEDCYITTKINEEDILAKEDYWPRDVSNFVHYKIGPYPLGYDEHPSCRCQSSLTLLQLIKERDKILKVDKFFGEVVLTEMERIDSDFSKVRAVYAFD